jgi:hypothetical protein
MVDWRVSRTRCSVSSDAFPRRSTRDESMPIMLGTFKLWLDSGRSCASALQAPTLTGGGTSEAIAWAALHRYCSQISLLITEENLDRMENARAWRNGYWCTSKSHNISNSTWTNNSSFQTKERYLFPQCQLPSAQVNLARCNQNPKQSEFKWWIIKCHKSYQCVFSICKYVARGILF